MTDVDPAKPVTVRQHNAYEPGAEFYYGMELILCLRRCNPEAIRYGNGLEKFAQDLVEKIDMVAFPISDDETTWVRHFGHANPKTSGYTVIQPIETSSIVMHLSEGKDSAHVNVFSCQEFDPQVAIAAAIEYFRPAEVIVTVLER